MGGVLVGLSGIAGALDGSGGDRRPTAPATAGPPGEIDPLSGSAPSFQYDARNTGATDAAGPREASEPVLTAEVPGAIRAPPAIVDGVAFFGGIHGPVVAVDTGTGRVAWTGSTGGREYVGARHTPTVADATVYHATDRGTVEAWTVDGVRLWTFEADGPISRSGRRDSIDGTDPAVAEGRVFVNRGDGVYAVDADTGALRWKLPVSEVGPRALAVADETVYFGRLDDRLSAIDAASGTPKWSYDPDYAVTHRSPTVADGTVYAVTNAGSEADDPTVVAVNAADGTERWTYATAESVDSSATYHDGTLYVLDSHGGLYALDGADGTELWRDDAARASEGSPVVADGIVYVVRSVMRDDRPIPQLQAFSPDGKRRWSIEPGFAPEAGPVVLDERVVLVEDGRMVVLQ